MAVVTTSGPLMTICRHEMWEETDRTSLFTKQFQRDRHLDQLSMSVRRGKTVAPEKRKVSPAEFANEVACVTTKAQRKEIRVDTKE
jgi:hypothetical protein